MSEAYNLEWWPGAHFQKNPVQSVVVCGRRFNPPVFSHVVNFPRLEIPLKGSYTNQVESGDGIKQVQITPGTVLFAAPNCWNLPEWQPGLELLTLQFGREQFGISLIAAQSGIYPDLQVRKHSLPRPLNGPLPHMLAVLQEMQAQNTPERTYIPMVTALIWALEDQLRQPPGRPLGRAMSLLEEIKAYLQSHYQYEITRDSVAQQFNITPNQLSRLFRSHGQLTFNGYLTQVRIDRAKHLLHSYALKLDDIATRCGYHDTPYFCHVFKRLTKSTPQEFRLRERQAQK
ncbi:MAG TPA: AraC family transcriptional regulator [Verrucomicrobiae bacterium]